MPIKKLSSCCQSKTYIVPDPDKVHGSDEEVTYLVECCRACGKEVEAYVDSTTYEKYDLAIHILKAMMMNPRSGISPASNSAEETIKEVKKYLNGIIKEMGEI